MGCALLPPENDDVAAQWQPGFGFRDLVALSEDGWMVQDFQEDGRGAPLPRPR
jgi:hypothetical protein